MPRISLEAFIMRCHLAVAIIAIAINAAGAEQPYASHSFESFPVGAVYRGPPAMPDFQGRDRQFRDFRTRIVNGIREGANFASRYKII